MAEPYRTFLIDIDGTVLIGDRVLPGAPELLAFARAQGRRFCFLTNNSYRRPGEVAAFLTRCGLPCAPEQVVAAGSLAAERAARLSRRAVFVLGSASLAAMVEAAGGNVGQENADVVLVGLDRELTYARLSAACRALGAGARLVAVNHDLTVPTGAGLEPGCGVLLGALRAYQATRPLVCGKPSPVLAGAAIEHLGGTRRSTLMIGDSLDVDIRMARRARIAGALVNTGVVAPPRLARELQPDHVFAGLPELVAWLEGQAAAPDSEVA